VGTDLLEWDKKVYVLMVDYYSWFIEIAKHTGTTSSTTQTASLPGMASLRS
jgi:hypothetical protein